MNLKYKNEPQSAIYPGIFVPSTDIHEANNLSTSISEERFAAWRITEGLELFTLEVNLPGVEKEDLLVHVENGGREISVIYKVYEPHQAPVGKVHCAFKLHEMHIPMPSNTDLSFVRAEFFNSKLLIVIPKGFTRGSDSITEILIY